ncbi:MAG: hypothetical protein JO022_05220 [Acidobacteriaceae bacterium]|nr:hypothetical protein [Acidobacteriaceae bacterium]
MTNFEDELKRALARQSPPSDFSARVLSALDGRQVRAQPRFRPQSISWIWNWRFAPVLACALTLSAGAFYWQHERAERGQAAKEKLLVAMHIAGSELQQARTRVFQIQGPEGKQ